MASAKRRRQLAVLSLVSQEKAWTQEILLAELQALGFRVAQATVSRDLRELGLSKAPIPGGGFRYIERDSPQPSSRLAKVVHEVVNSCDQAKNLVVIKTIPGLAPAVCAAIDAMRLPGVVGTLAGDDTGLAICRDETEAAFLRNHVLQSIGTSDNAP